MNSKTTLVLAFLLAGLVMGYIGIRRQKPQDAAPATSIPAAKTEDGVARDLISDPLGTVTKVVAWRGSDQWVFEKKAPEGGGAAVWHMTKPMEMRVQAHEVDRIAREGGKIPYELSYKGGEGGITGQAAGLEPPFATVELTDDTGKTAAIEIGKPVSENETYARKKGGDEIVVAKSNLRKLLKNKPLEYRDMQLWNFPAEQAVRAEVCETPPGGSMECNYFVRTGGSWMLEKPVAAKATSKVDEMIKAFARLRVSGWHDDDASKLKVYGLDPAALQISVTVEETVAAKKEGAEAPKEGEQAPEEPPTEKKTTVYNLQLSDRGPIGEDTKIFARSGDENAVATIFKSTTDKLRPDMSQWREMQLVSYDPTKATKIELNSGGKNTVVIQKDGQWVFEEGGAPAEQHAVTELLAGIKGMKAVSFLEGAEAAQTPSFDSPQADIRLTIPGDETPHRLTVGAYTDPARKILVYVRGAESGPVAKVKASDVATLVRPSAALRDRTVFSFDSEAANQISIVRPNTFVPGSKQEFALSKENGIWSMAAPARAATRTDEVVKLLGSLSSLKAESVVGDSSQASSFGLHEPSMKVSISVEASQPAVEGGTNGAAQTLHLALSHHDGKLYGARADGGPVYELNKSLADQLTAEFRTTEVLEFEPKDVQQFTIRLGDEVHSFARKSGKWIYESEPDLPIDSTKVDKVLTEAKAFKTDRYAAYDSNLQPYELSKPHYELTYKASGESGQKAATLLVSAKTVSHQSSPAAADPAKPAAPSATTAHFAAISGKDGVFLLNSDSVKKVFVPLADLEKK